MSFLARWARPPIREGYGVEPVQAASSAPEDTVRKTLAADEPLVPISETRFEETVQSTAVEILNREGVRRFQLDGVATLGIWQAADTPEIRAAISTLYSQDIQIVRLEDECVPAKYKTRKPKHIVKRETGDEPRISWHEWKARMLNEIFEMQGVTGKPSDITADDVRRGEEARRGALPAKCRPQNHSGNKHAR